MLVGHPDDGTDHVGARADETENGSAESDDRMGPEGKILEF